MYGLSAETNKSSRCKEVAVVERWVLKHVFNATKYLPLPKSVTSKLLDNFICHNVTQYQLIHFSLRWSYGVLLYEILTVGKLNYTSDLCFKYSLLFYFQDQKALGKLYQQNIYLSLCASRDVFKSVVKWLPRDVPERIYHLNYNNRKILILALKRVNDICFQKPFEGCNGPNHGCRQTPVNTIAAKGGFFLCYA